jgi:putative peptidoglycan lipid II flippase
MNPTGPVKKKNRLSIGNAAALLVAASLLGQILGFLRTKLVNANFPTVGPHSTDAYFAAFNIPDFFFFTLAAGAMGVAFMPVLSDRLHKGDRKGMWELSTSLMNLLAIIMAIVGVIIIIFARPLIHHIVAPGLSPAQTNTAVDIMRLIAFNPLLFTISGVLTSVQQTMGRFFFFAIAPLFYNSCIIISALVFSTIPPHHGGPFHLGLVGLGVGALIGCILQVIVVIFGLTKLHFHWHRGIHWRSPGFRTILGNLPPRSLDQGMDQVNNIVETHIASGLGGGNITYYNNAFILSTAPILLIGTTISTAAFPRLNARLSQHRPDLFRRDFLMVLRVAGLALAQSIVATVEVAILTIIMLIRDPRLFDINFWSGVWRIISVTGFSVVAGFIMITLLPLGARDRGIITLGTKVFLIASVTFGVHVLVSALFGLEEARPVFRRVRRIVLKPIRVEV